MRSVTVDAPAKINLGLRVLSRRPDGFHSIETLFQSIDLCDTLTVERRDAGIDLSLRGEERSTAGVPDGPGNLAWSAAELFCEETGCGGASIELVKRIPVAAGLGGGSADAAGVLVALRALHAPELSDDALERLGARLGSDVPFMVRGGTAVGRGRGDELERVTALEGFALVLATPPVPVSAARAYDSVRIGLTGGGSFIRLNCSVIRDGDRPAIVSALTNDLEPGVVSFCPEVARAESAMRTAGATAVAMTGSGPTVYGLAPNRAAAATIASRLDRRGWIIHIAEPIDSGCRVVSA